jgi:hypothetical protein
LPGRGQILLEEHGMVGRLGARSHPWIVRREACAQRGDKGVSCLLITPASLHSAAVPGPIRPRAARAACTYSSRGSQRTFIAPGDTSARSRISVGFPLAPRPARGPAEAERRWSRITRRTRGATRNRGGAVIAEQEVTWKRSPKSTRGC